MIIQFMYEMNHTYIVVSGEEIEQTENYRYRMLSANNIPCILPLEIRIINNEKRIFVEITGKESILNLYSTRSADRSDIKKLFEAIFEISNLMAKYLIEETDIIVSPEMIYKNLLTGEYEFICIPLIGESSKENGGMKSLLHFLILHLDNNDEQLVTALYTINEMYETGKAKFSLAYEYFIEETMEEDIVEEPETYEEIVEKEKRNIYIPTLKEIFATSMCILGILLIGYSFYSSLLLQR